MRDLGILWLCALALFPLPSLGMVTSCRPGGLYNSTTGSCMCLPGWSGADCGYCAGCSMLSNCSATCSPGVQCVTPTLQQADGICLLCPDGLAGTGSSCSTPASQISSSAITFRTNMSFPSMASQQANTLAAGFKTDFVHVLNLTDVNSVSNGILVSVTLDGLVVFVTINVLPVSPLSPASLGNELLRLWINGSSSLYANSTSYSKFITRTYLPVTLASEAFVCTDGSIATSCPPGDDSHGNESAFVVGMSAVAILGVIACVAFYGWRGQTSRRRRKNRKKKKKKNVSVSINPVVSHSTSELLKKEKRKGAKRTSSQFRFNYGRSKDMHYESVNPEVELEKAQSSGTSSESDSSEVREERTNDGFDSITLRATQTRKSSLEPSLETPLEDLTMSPPNEPVAKVEANGVLPNEEQPYEYEKPQLTIGTTYIDSDADTDEPTSQTRVRTSVPLSEVLREKHKKKLRKWMRKGRRKQRRRKSDPHVVSVIDFEEQRRHRQQKRKIRDRKSKSYEDKSKRTPKTPTSPSESSTSFFSTRGKSSQERLHSNRSSSQDIRESSHRTSPEVSQETPAVSTTEVLETQTEPVPEENISDSDLIDLDSEAHTHPDIDRTSGPSTDTSPENRMHHLAAKFIALEHSSISSELTSAEDLYDIHEEEADGFISPPSPRAPLSRADMERLTQLVRSLTTIIREVNIPQTQRMMALQEIVTSFTEYVELGKDLRALSEQGPNASNFWSDIVTIHNTILPAFRNQDIQETELACKFVSTMATAFYTMEDWIRLFIPILRDMIIGLECEVQDVQWAFDDCINLIIPKAVFWAPTLFNQIIQVCMSRRLPDHTRAYCCTYLTAILQQVHSTRSPALATRLQRHCNDCAKVVFEYVKPYNDPDVRFKARGVYLAFEHLWPRKAKRLFDQFDQITQKAIRIQEDAEVGGI